MRYNMSFMIEYQRRYRPFQKLILGDLNVRVGADQDSWPSCLGQNGVGKLDDSIQRVLCASRTRHHQHILPAQI